MLLSIIPAVLGFHPEISVVLLGTKQPSRKLRITLRFSLEDPSVPEHVARVVEGALTVLSTQGHDCAKAIGYGPDEMVTPFIDRLQERAGEHGIQLTELLRVEDGRYWSYLCTDAACCPREGTPYDSDPDLISTGLLVAGVPRVLANREALADLVAPADGPAARAMRQATRRAQAYADELSERARASADAVTRRHPVAPMGIKVAQKVITNYRQSRTTVSYQDAARLLVSLRDQWVRDDAWSRMEPDHKKAHLRLWLDLTRLARYGYAAAPASLLAFVAWQSGNGTLANVALDRALNDDPTYKMARLLSRIIDSGTSPEAAKPSFTPAQVAEIYAKIGT
jgi:Domain of unknown function (DUF4192)